MAAKKERWGAYIELEPGDPGRRFFEYKVWIGKYDKQNLKARTTFVSNPQISRKIAKVKKMVGFVGKPEIGDITFSVREEKKEITVSGFYPFHAFMPTRNPQLPIKLREKIFKMLTGMGLANRIELRVLKGLQKKFPDYMYIPGNENNSDSRIKQLENRGSELGEPVPIQKEIQRISERIGGFAKKKRWRRRVRRRIAAPLKRVAGLLDRARKPRKIG
jgi:hypothetical protein